MGRHHNPEAASRYRERPTTLGLPFETEQLKV